MGMGLRRKRQASLWVASRRFREPNGIFYDRVNRIVEEQRFDAFAESACEKFYATRGRPSVPGAYVRMLLVGYFEGLTSERGIAWRRSDSLSLQQSLGAGLDGDVADRSTVCRERGG